MADERPYLDFDLLIEALESGSGYRARVLRSPAGGAAGTFEPPFHPLEIENFLLRIGRPRRLVRRADSPELESIRTFGGKLFDAVFAGDLRSCLRSSLDVARSRDCGLRIRLRLDDAPALADLPWEYLYNPTVRRFLALSSTTPIVRSMDVPELTRPLAVTGPLRVLVAISAPRDHVQLDVDREWEKVRESAGELQRRGLIVLKRLDHVTFAALHATLAADQFHVFHFIGHGAFDAGRQDGILVFEDDLGRGKAVSAEDLGILLHDHPTMRLALLNSCEGARTSPTDPFSGSAQTLLQQGLPAVVAMQFEITDEAAVLLARYFYAGLAQGRPLDAALAEARKAIWGAGNEIEWATPVLYLRSPDARIFDVDHGAIAGGEGVALVSAPSTPLGEVTPASPRPEPGAPVARSSATGSVLVVPIVIAWLANIRLVPYFDLSALVPLAILFLAWRAGKAYAAWAASLVVMVPWGILNLAIDLNTSSNIGLGRLIEEPLALGFWRFPYSSVTSLIMLGLLGYLAGLLFEHVRAIASRMPLLVGAVGDVKRSDRITFSKFMLLPLLVLANVTVQLSASDLKIPVLLPVTGAAAAALLLASGRLGPAASAASGALLVTVSVALKLFVAPPIHLQFAELGHVAAFAALGYVAGLLTSSMKAAGPSAIAAPLGPARPEVLRARRAALVGFATLQVALCVRIVVGGAGGSEPPLWALHAAAILSGVACGARPALYLNAFILGGAALLAPWLLLGGLLYEVPLGDGAALRFVPATLSAVTPVLAATAAWAAGKIDVLRSRANRIALCVGVFAAAEAVDVVMWGTALSSPLGFFHLVVGGAPRLFGILLGLVELLLLVGAVSAGCAALRRLQWRKAELASA